MRRISCANTHKSHYLARAGSDEVANAVIEHSRAAYATKVEPEEEKPKVEEPEPKSTKKSKKKNQNQRVKNENQLRF